MLKDKNKVLSCVFCSLLMLITAASDALRGVFLPQFRNSFSLTEPQSSRIIMVSYIGNLIFLFIGGYLSDRLPKKRFLGGVLILWGAALFSYVFTENYYFMLAAMLFSMGGSTMLSTTVNMITPLLFAYPAMLVSIFNFTQGVGITITQNIGGRFADKMSSWHIANAILLSLAAVCFALLMMLKLPEQTALKKKPKTNYPKLIKEPATILLICICGFYFIAEHGLMNWLISYGSEHLGLTVSESAMYLSMFFGGITVGRFIFAPFIERLGIFKSLLIWSLFGAVLYTLGIALGRVGLILLAVSGLAFSIIYPMLVVLIGKFYDPAVSGSATGFVLSIATFFDIFFNAFYGDVVEKTGYGKAIIILPVSAVMFCLLLYVLRSAVRDRGNL